MGVHLIKEEKQIEITDLRYQINEKIRVMKGGKIDV